MVSLPESPASVTSSLMPCTPVSTSGGVSSASRSTSKAWFTSEIQQMMYGLGDCRKPLTESAALIESIVHQQMVNLLLKVEDIARQRNARFIGIEDFLFLLRKDKVKLRRLVKYMELKDVKQSALKTVDDESDDWDGKPPFKRRKKMCFDFLNTIDHTGEMTAFIDDGNYADDVKHSRALRAELQTRGMDSQEYKDFAEARQASFTPRYKGQKFKEWLVQGISLDIKPNPMAVEVLSYMAYETVSQVMDLTLIVKRDMSAKSDDPFSKVVAHSVMNYDPSYNPKGDMAPPPTTNVMTALKSPISSAPASPLTSPPSTPTTPGPAGLGLSLNASGSSSKSKGSSKKKKKAGSSLTRDIHTYNAVTPHEIREAIRRYTNAIGPFADFSKVPLVSCKSRLLCA